MRFARTLPSLRFSDVKVTKEAEHVYRLETSLYNSGYLSTWLTNRAKQLKYDRPVTLKLSGCNVLSGDQEIAGLGGFAAVSSGYGYGSNISTYGENPAVKKLTWIVNGKEGDTVEIIAEHEKSGPVTVSVVLP